MAPIQLSTIGFTKSSAEHFFERLRKAGVRKIVDVRLHNTSQLAGFAKSDDLAYFLRAIAGIQYVHEPLLAPTDRILDAYKKQKGTWSNYEQQFLELMHKRQIEAKSTPTALEGACLLCSESTHYHCHRRLVCEYLSEKWGEIGIRHL